jgi:hypothetical protein
MDSIYIVRSHFENYDSTSWKIIGLFTDKKIAEEIAKKWEDKYKADSRILAERIVDQTIRFGKYKYRLSPRKIREFDPGYFNWLVNTVDSMRCLKDYFD